MALTPAPLPALVPDPAASPLSLDHMPDDILFLILAHLNTARDHAQISSTCKRLHNFVMSDGWRAFVVRCFSGGLSIRDYDAHHPSGVGSRPGQSSSSASSSKASAATANQAADTLRWDQLAESLTWQSRAWDRRALTFQAMVPRGRYPMPTDRGPGFRPPLAVHFQPDLLGHGSSSSGDGLLGGIRGEEMVVWGAGVDIVARYRRRGTSGWLDEGPEDDRLFPNEKDEAGSGGNDDEFNDPRAKSRWRQVDGRNKGFWSGQDDVQSVSIVQHACGVPNYRGILAGRRNGNLVLLSGEFGSFGKVISHFSPEYTMEATSNSSNTHRRPVKQDCIYSVDISGTGRTFGGLDNRSGMAAVTTNSHVVFYALPGKREGSRRIAPAGAFDVGQHGMRENYRYPYNFRWMAADGLAAIGFGCGPSQLCYIQATPSEFVLVAAAKNHALMSRFGLQDDIPLVPSTMQPLTPSNVTGGNGNLMLSAWQDGTCRLLDIRTPSPWDLAYQDGAASFQAYAALLVYGTQHFLAGCTDSTTLKIFDLRWPRRYHHADALPCDINLPFPEYDLSIRARDYFTQNHDSRAACDRMADRPCTWHTGSHHPLYRPNCSAYLDRIAINEHPNAGIWSLARSSAVSTDGRATSSWDLAAPNFYAGLNNGIFEGILSEQGDYMDYASATGPSPLYGDPNFKFPDVLQQRPPPLNPPSSCRTFEARNAWSRYQAGVEKRHHFYRTVDLQWYLQEIGDSMLSLDIDCPIRDIDLRRRHIKNHRRHPPRMRAYLDSPENFADNVEDLHFKRPMTLPFEELKLDPILRRRHRLDYSFQRLSDYCAFYKKENVRPD